MRVPQLGAFKDRRRTVEKGLHQHRQLDDRVGRVGHAAADPYGEAAGHRRHLFEKAALAHPGAPLDQDDRADARKKLVQLLTQDRELRLPAADRLGGSTLLRSEHLWCHSLSLGR